MAVAEIIGAAIGVLLLVVVAYILVGGTISAAETLANAQKDLTLQNEARLHTNIYLNRSDISSTGGHLTMSIANTGNEIVSDFKRMDLYTFNTSLAEWQHLTYDTTGKTGTWKITRIDNDYVHPNQLDPGETMWVEAVYAGDWPSRVQMTTSNGVSASTIT